MTCSKDFGRLLQAGCLGLIGMLAVAGCGGSEDNKKKDGGDGGPPVDGQQVAVLNVTPSSVNLGTLQVNTPGVASVTVTNIGKATSGTISATGSAGITVSGCSAQLPAGQSCPLSIVVAPTAVGAFSGTVSIAASPGATTPLVVAVIAQVSTQNMFKVLPTTIDLGNIPVGTPAPRQTITVTAAVAISDLTFASNGPDVSIDKAASTCTAVLAANASCTLAVNFVASTPGAKSESVVINAGGANASPVIVPISAMAQAPAKLAISPSTTQNLTTPAGQPSSPTNFLVANTGDVPTGTVTVTLGGTNASSFAISANNCLVLASTATCNVSVIYKPAATAATPESATLIVTDTGAGASSVQVPLTGTPSAQTDLVITAPSSDVGTVLINTTGTSTVFTVTNNGDTASGTLSVTLSSPEFTITNDTCTGATLAKGQTCTIAIALKPVTAGAKKATLTVTGAAIPTKPGKKDITGTGTTGAIFEATPTALDFATVRVNNTGTAQTVTIRNVGGSPSGAISFTRGGNFAVFPISSNNCSAALAPAATCTFTVTFTPAEAKAETASYTVTDGATSATVTVAGVGLPETGITVSPSPVSSCPEMDLTALGQTTSYCFPPTVVGGLANAVTQITTDAGVTVQYNKTIVFTVTAKSPLPNGMADTGAVTAVLGGTNASDFTITENNCKTVLLAGASCTVTVAFAPTAVGLRQASLNVTTANGGADSATLQGTGLSVVEIKPLSTKKVVDGQTKTVSGLDFGQVPVLGDIENRTNDYMVVVRGPNTTTSFTSQVLTTLTDPSQPADFMYDGAVTNRCNTSTNEAVTLNFQTKANVGNWDYITGAEVFVCTFSVRFYPQSTKGDKKATLTATGTGPVSDTKELTGTATGSLTLDAETTTDFGSIPVGETTNADVTLSMLSNDDLRFSLVNHSTTTDLGPASITLGGPNVDQFALVRDYCTTMTLTHGNVATSSCKISVAFAPTSAGAKTAILTGSAGGETTSLTLTGGASDPFNITISPDQYVFANDNVHDFGTVAQEAAGAWHAFTITNPAGSPRSAQVSYTLRSDTASAFTLANGNNHAFGSCGGTGTTPLAAGASCTFWVQFKPLKTDAVSGLTDRLSGWVQAIDKAKGEDNAAEVHVVGKVGSVLSIAPATVAFPNTAAGTPSAAITLTVTNNGSSTESITLDITPNVTLAPFSIDQATGCAIGDRKLAAGASCPLAVTFIGPQTLDLYEKTLTVGATGYGTVAKPTAVSSKLSGTSVAPAKLEAVGFGTTAQIVNLGGVRIGASSGDVKLTFKNTGSAATSSLNFFWGAGTANAPDSEFIIAGEAAETCVGKTSLAPGATCSISVHFTPATLTGAVHEKAFKLSAVNGGEVTIFTFHGYSLSNTNSAYIAISGGANAFYTFPNSTPVNSTSTLQVFQVINGTASVFGPLAVDNTANFTLIATGSDAGSSPCGGSIAASSSCTFAVAFKPTVDWTATTAYRLGTVSLAGTGAEGTQLGLIGRVQSPAVLTLSPATTASPDPYDFGQVVIGGANPTRAFTITNTGERTSAALTVTTAAPYSHAGACDGATLAAGQSCIGSISVNPGSVTGPLTPGTLSVTATGATGATATLNAEAVRGATLTLDVSTASFTATPVGTLSSETKTISITNASGSQTSGLLTLSLADTTNFTLVSTGTCPLAGDPNATTGLVGGASCGVGVRFKPATLGTGTFSTTLVVNAAPGNTQTVNISGTATSALTTNPTSPYNSATGTLAVTVILAAGAPDTKPLKTSISGGNYMIVEDQCVTNKLTDTIRTCYIKVAFLGTAATPLKSGTLTIDGGSPGATAALVLNSTTPPTQ